MLRPASAAARHLVWSLGLVGALSLPLLTRTLPRLDWTLPPIHRSQPRFLTPLPSAAATAEKVATTPGANNAWKPLTAPPVSTTAPTPFRWPACVLLIWAAGVGLTLMRLLFGIASVRRIARASRPLEGGPLAAAATACRTLAIRRPVDFRQASAPGSVPVPMGWGCLRPTVILPAEAAQWPAEQVDAALLHELAHVQRQDWLVLMLAHLACAFYWFHPLVWLAAQQARQESEQASDDLVLGAGIGPGDYAGHLLSVVRSARAFRAAPVTAVALVRPSALNRRVRAILAPHPRRQGRTPRMAAAAVTLAALFACPLAALRPVGAAGAISSALRGEVIVVDAGHGGQDTGGVGPEGVAKKVAQQRRIGLVNAGVGPEGVTEKALNLAIAKRLRTALEQRGAVVSMTREGDTFSDPKARAQFANARHADYLISVHCDGGLHSKAESVVYYHGQQASGHRLAASVGQGMHQATDTPSGVASDLTRFHTGFAVLRGAAMPSVLVECGSITDPTDLARLRDTEGQQRIAEGIAAGLGAFQEGRPKNSKQK